MEQRATHTHVRTHIHISPLVRTCMCTRRDSTTAQPGRASPRKKPGARFRVVLRLFVHHARARLHAQFIFGIRSDSVEARVFCRPFNRKPAVPVRLSRDQGTTLARRLQRNLTFARDSVGTGGRSEGEEWCALCH